ncbi:protein ACCUMULATION AND REPLICATION OF CHLOROPLASTS 3 isoform X2 [Asparagus officinalis]|uniref:protein ACCUMULATION AND REPLICATION OF CHLOROPLASTS 3 isoform X2 n=1 Tax=Asparagus officinalis TaxID=4686 RepID=UPI00098E19A6|nr:protein ACCUMULATION AND REPLICATION OF CHLOROPLASTS 3 isoform X2 [Asparagus officinalis]
MATAIRITTLFSISAPSPSSSRSLHSHSTLINGLNRRISLLSLRASSESGLSPVEVIGIGSRKDALIDFCLSNPMASSSRLRFWTVHLGDSQKVQLLQRCHRAEAILRDVEFPLSLASFSAIILVASAGFGTDHIAAMELLNSVKSAGGLAVAILLKPFSFEGQRRVEEVDDLVNKLQKFSHLLIVVEADSLLKAEMETLAEALDSVNNAVFLAMHTISILMSEVHLKILNAPNEQMKEVKSFEVLQKPMEKLKLGLEQAITLTQQLHRLSSIVPSFLVISSDFASAILNFRRITECTGDVIFSTVHEPSLEPNLIVATLLVVGREEKRVSQKKSFLSGLALHFPFLFSVFGEDFSEHNGSISACLPSKTSEDARPNSESISLNLEDGILEAKVDEKETDPSRESIHSHEILGGDSSEINCESITENTYQPNSGSGGQRDQDNNSYFGPGFSFAQLWAKRRADFVRSGQSDMVENFTPPIGVKFSSEMCSNQACSESSLPETCSKMYSDSLHAANFSPRDQLSDNGLEALTEIYNIAFKALKRRNVDEPRKRGLLSERAASMLESERDLPRSWTPVVELQYRGGIYRGRCQGGLPEGKGCLSLTDGSFYDGMWHNGKRTGLGTFCYSNGDVFQGAWRDDLMHGKGWFYFHTGDRWFANFWKGKANGEGRFYSYNGSIFFGFFRNGWRHGECICIDVDGSRWTEVWKEGVLVSRTLLEKGPKR